MINDNFGLIKKYVSAVDKSTGEIKFPQTSKLLTMSDSQEIERLLSREKKTLSNYHSQEGFEDLHLANLSLINLKLGYLMFLLKDDIKSMKLRSYNVGLVDIDLVSLFSKSHSQFFNFDIARCLFVLLSDYEGLIHRYAKLRYKAHGQIPDMDTRVLKGESPIWCNTIQFFMEDNVEGVKRNLDILEAITLKRLSKKEELLRIDYAYYQALLEKDRAKCEELLAELISPTIHKKRKDNPILNQYISQPALGYAKLAWRQGIKVDIDSPLIPKELLPIKANDDYPIPYDFLKES